MSRGGIPVSWLLSVATAEGTEQTASNEESGGARPAEEKGCSQLSFLPHVDGRVVEIPDDDVGRPAHRNQNEDAGQDEEDPRGPQKVRFGPPVGAWALDVLRATDAKKQSNEGESDGHAHEGPGCLEDGWESQQRAIELALQADLGLSDAVHPEPFPEPFKDDDVAANESRYPPLRQERCSKSSHHAEETKNQTSDLQGIKCHRLCFED